MAEALIYASSSLLPSAELSSGLVAQTLAGDRFFSNGSAWIQIMENLGAYQSVPDLVSAQAPVAQNAGATALVSLGSSYAMMICTGTAWVNIGALNLQIDTNNVIKGAVNPQTGVLLDNNLPAYNVNQLPLASASKGMRAWIANIGIGGLGCEFYCDGTVWRPIGGQCTLLAQFGSMAAPIASINQAGSGLAAKQFITPPKIPGGLLQIGSKIQLNAWISRNAGTVNANIFAARLGTTGTPGTTGDAQITIASIAATANESYRCNAEITFSSALAFTSTVWLSPNNIGTNAFADQNTNVNIANDMFIGLEMASGNYDAGTTYSLLGYEIIYRF